MSLPAQKTPASLLQELTMTNDIEADYKLVSVEGAVHEPTFTYRVQVNEVEATASGQSKKKAKHAAAKAVLEILLSEDGLFKEGFVFDGILVNSQTLDDVIAESVTAPPPPPVEEICSANPVGALQEYCMTLKEIAPPYYETEKETGLPHEKVFSVVCVVNGWQTSGEGKSKRLAKRQAAKKMLPMLQSMNLPLKEKKSSKRS